ncbi:MAG: hypothetical protein ACLFVP_03845 [Candidatus Bathyarchaeia archaeon]
MDVNDLILLHLDRRPLMGVRDIYKLLYQAVFGVGHIMGEDAWYRLKAEVERLDLGEQPEEPLIEEISPKGEMIRVNLRPLLRRGLPLEPLYRAMLETRSTGSAEDLMRYWQAFLEMVEGGVIDLPCQVRKIKMELQAGHLEPKHHTEVYRRAYNPSYRVVERAAYDPMKNSVETHSVTDRECRNLNRCV